MQPTAYPPAVAPPTGQWLGSGQPVTPAASPAAMPNFVDPAAIGAARPRIAEMDGRVVVIEPKRIEHGVRAPEPNPEGRTQSRITADIYVLDGGPITFGGAPEKGRPHGLTVATPYLASDCFISQTNLVSALSPHIGTGVVLGRIGRGVARGMNNPPWNLYKLTTEGHEHEANARAQSTDPVSLAQRNAAARQLVQAFYAAKLAGQWANPTPTPIVGAPPVTTAHTYAASAPQFAQPVAPTAAQPVAPPPLVAQAPAIPAPPPGWDANMWASLTDAQRGQVLATTAPAAASAPNPF